MSGNNFSNSIIGSLLSFINRKTFNNLVKKYNTDYNKYKYRYKYKYKFLLLIDL